MRRSSVAFIAVAAMGLFVGWYGGIDWTERSGWNAYMLINVLLVAGMAFCVVKAGE